MRRRYISIVYYNSGTYRAELITGSAHFYCNFQHSREGGGFMEDVIMGIIKLVEIIAGQIFKDGQNK